MPATVERFSERRVSAGCGIFISKSLPTNSCSHAGAPCPSFPKTRPSPSRKSARIARRPESGKVRAGNRAAAVEKTCESHGRRFDADGKRFDGSDVFAVFAHVKMKTRERDSNEKDETA